MWVAFDKLLLFLSNFVHAVKLAIYEYDEKLKMTKTPKDRVMIWLMVAFLTVLIIALLLFSSSLAVGSFLKFQNPH